MSTPAPQPAHEMLDHPTLGRVASALNAAEADFILAQGSTPRAWLQRMVRDAEALAREARQALEALP